MTYFCVAPQDELREGKTEGLTATQPCREQGVFICRKQRKSLGLERKGSQPTWAHPWSFLSTLAGEPLTHIAS